MGTGYLRGMSGYRRGTNGGYRAQSDGGYGKGYIDIDSVTRLLDFRSPSYFANAATGGWMTKPAAASKAWRWKCNEASGNISDDLSGDGVALVKTGTAYYRRWTPLLQSDGFTRVGLELSGTDCYFAEGSNTPLDLTTETFGAAGWFFYKGTAGGVILGKRTAAGLNGYQLMLEGSTGRLYWNLCDGTSRGPFYVWASGLLVPGTWNFFSTVVNRTTNLATGFLNGAQKDSADIAALTGSLTSATPFRVGSTADPVAWYPGAFSELMFWKGGVMTLAEHQAIYGRAFQDPSRALTYARTGGVSYEVASDASGVRVIRFSANQVPFAYASALVGGDNGAGLGLPSHGAVTNLCLQSEDPTTTWTTSNLTAAKNQAEAPCGAQTAGKLTATADGGYLKQLFTSIAAAVHTFTLWIMRDAGADVAGTIRIYKNSTLTLRASQAFTAGATWTRITVSATADLNDCSIWIVLDSNATAVRVWGMQLAAATEWPGVYVPTTTASASSAAPTIVHATPTDFVIGARGEIEAVILPTYAAQAAIGTVLEGTAGSSRIALERTTNEAIYCNVKDGGGTDRVAAETTATSSGQAKQTAQGRYNATLPKYASGKYGDAGVGGTRVGNGDANWIAVDPTAIGVGVKAAGGSPLEGIIATVQVVR